MFICNLFQSFCINCTNFLIMLLLPICCLRRRLFFFWTHYILYSRIPRIRALLPAFAGDSFVNGPRKTNATFGVACFSFGLITSYTHESRAFALYCLLSQAIRSLMVQEKQMPPSVSLVFLLDSLYDDADQAPITVINDLLQSILKLLLTFVCHL